jgi:hypothetical protein
MDGFVRIVREFLYRDLAFILGGTLVIASIAYCLRHHLLPHFDFRNPPTWSLFLFPAMAYVVGYAVQDIGGIIGITFTGYVREPHPFFRGLFSRFSQAPWTDTNILQNRNGFQFEVQMSRLDVPAGPLRNLQRILDLKVIGMSVGGCCLLSSVILLLFCAWSDKRAATLGLLFLVLGASLVCLGWVKALQQMQLLQAISDEGFPKKSPPSTPAPRRRSARARP